MAQANSLNIKGKGRSYKPVTDKLEYAWEICLRPNKSRQASWAYEWVERAYSDAWQCISTKGSTQEIPLAVWNTIHSDPTLLLCQGKCSIFEHRLIFILASNASDHLLWIGDWTYSGWYNAFYQEFIRKGFKIL